MTTAIGHKAPPGFAGKVQGTRPQTIGYALADAPVGQAPWIYGLFQDASDNGGDPESVFTRDEMLDDIILYWLINPGAASARLYCESQSSMSAAPPAEMRMPTAISVFAKEPVRRIPRRWAEARFSNQVHFSELAAGGHFAASEQPGLLVEEIRTGFRGLRT